MKARCQGSPLQPSPPKRETSEEMLLKEEQQKRAARNKKRAEVRFGTFDVSLELLVRVTHVIRRTVVITENGFKTTNMFTVKPPHSSCRPGEIYTASNSNRPVPTNRPAL